jgi:hypothetical protein
VDNGHSIEATGYVMPDFVASEIHRVTTADGLPLIAACTTTTRPAVARALK